MVVIIEGLDGVGKTTLSKEFVKKYNNYTYIKESYTDDIDEKNHRVALLLERALSKDNYIYDRCSLIDDYVYSFLNKNKRVFYEYYTLVSTILGMCKIIHLNLDEETRKQRFLQRGDEYIKDESWLFTARENYNHFYKYYELYPIYIDLEENLNKNINKIYESITYCSN